MTPPKTIMVFALGLAAFAAACGHSSHITKEADHGTADLRMEAMIDSKTDNPVHTIVMPHDEPQFPPGPGRDEFVTACVVCHSPRYITMQPRFSRTTWLSEVKKMQDTYGAHISDEQAQRITDYLFSINGKAGTGHGPKGTYGE
jgi:mono/diheme cytochrome c family protein